MINLTEYFANSINNLTKSALKVSKLSLKEKFYLYRFSLSCKKAAKIREINSKNGLHIPPFLIASITSSCNLSCKGCYARANNTCGEDVKPKYLTLKRFGEIFCEAESLGISFILLAGGEPLIRYDVLKLAALHKKILFPVFTNGTLFEGKYGLFYKNRNLLPVISIEGGKSATDNKARRGCI